MRHLIITAAALTLMGGTAASAEPGATVSVRSSSAAHAQWTGKSDLSREVALCILSNTGSFVLHVTGRSATLAGTGQLDFTLQDPMGGLASDRADVGEQALMSGSVDPQANCDRGSNARVRVSVPRAQLLAGTAGDLALDLQFAVFAR